MTLRQYLILITLGTAISFMTWLTVIFLVNPFESGILGFVFFYLSLAVTLVGLLSLVGFGVRMLLYRHEGIVLREVTIAFRQACAFTLVVIGSLFLQSRSLLSWWNVLLFVGGLTILEFFFLSSRYPRTAS